MIYPDKEDVLSVLDGRRWSIISASYSLLFALAAFAAVDFLTASLAVYCGVLSSDELFSASAPLIWSIYRIASRAISFFVCGALFLRLAAELNRSDTRIFRGLWLLLCIRLYAFAAAFPFCVSMGTMLASVRRIFSSYGTSEKNAVLLILSTILTITALYFFVYLLSGIICAPSVFFRFKITSPVKCMLISMSAIKYHRFDLFILILTLLPKIILFPFFCGEILASLSAFCARLLTDYEEETANISV